jgi:hypothetical protein
MRRTEFSDMTSSIARRGALGGEPDRWVVPARQLVRAPFRIGSKRNCRAQPCRAVDAAWHGPGGNAVIEIRERAA